MTAFGVGASVLRKEDDRFLRGRGQFVGDIRMTGMREVAFVRSPVAHARLKAVHIPDEYRDRVYAAEQLVGVKPIVSAPPLKGFKPSAEPILATGKVRYVGEMIAMCVAATRAEAEDIAAAVTLELDELPAVTDMIAACRPDLPLVHEEWGDNIFVSFSEDRPIEEVAKTAAISVQKSIRTSRHCMFPMEGRGVVAYRDARLKNLTLITSTQFPHSVQTGLSECLGLEHGHVRIISPDVGGGFGYKGLLCREEVALGWLAMQVDHPVRWLEDCREHLVANANCREHHYEITGYATAEGKLLGIDCVGHVDAGAYSSYPISSAPEAAQIANLLPGPYVFTAFRCRSHAVATNKCPIIPYRGVARSGVCLAIEVVMDAIAREAQLETYEVRLRNMVRPEQMPFDNVVGKHFDSGDHPECVRRAVEAIRWHDIRARQQTPEPDGRLIGVGLSFFVEQGAHGTSVLAAWGRPIVPGYEQANVRLTPDGEIEIHVGTHSHGQGHETTFAQVAHEILGVDFDKIRVLQGDTLYTPYSTSTWGSRSMVHGGGAVARASRLLAQRAARIGAWLLQADASSVKVENGKVVAGASSVTLREVARAWYLQPQNLPADVDTGGLDVTAGYRAERDSGTFSYAAHAAVVAVDPATGLVEILDYVVVEDGGVLVNPMVVDGQVRGGTAQGIGTCLYEAMPFDAQGQPLASTMLDYMLPGAPEVPDIRVLHMATPSPYTEFGIKGIGEGGAVGPPAALVSAVNDALRPLGVEVHDLPLTPERILVRDRWAHMKPVAFDIVRARSVGEATRLLAGQDGGARLVAGAQSLGPMLNLRLAQPRLLIDITGIRELIRIEETGDSVTVGACVTTANIEDGRLPGAGFDPLRAIATGIAYRAVRSRATVGGSLCHADPAADWTTVLCALGAECLVTGQNGTRRVPLDQFITGAYETSLGAGDMLEAISLRRLSRRARLGYFKVCRKVGEFASAMAAVLDDPEREAVRAVIGATRGRPIVLPDARHILRSDHTIDETEIFRVLDQHGITDRVVRRQQVAAVTRACHQARAS